MHNDFDRKGLTKRTKNRLRFNINKNRTKTRQRSFAAHNENHSTESADLWLIFLLERFPIKPYGQFRWIGIGNTPFRFFWTTLQIIFTISWHMSLKSIIIQDTRQVANLCVSDLSYTQLNLISYMFTLTYQSFRGVIFFVLLQVQY